MNSTKLIQGIQDANVSSSFADVLKSYAHAFMGSPIKIGLLTLGIVVAILLMMKQLIDNQETYLQNRIWYFFLQFGVFMLTLIALIAFDAGEIVFLNKFG